MRVADLEMGVLGENRAVGANVGLVPVLVLADSRNSASGQASSAGADELCKTADEFELGFCASG